MLEVVLKRFENPDEMRVFGKVGLRLSTSAMSRMYRYIFSAQTITLNGI